MEKGTFSVEWLAQSSRGGAQPLVTAHEPSSLLGDTGGKQPPSDLATLRGRGAADCSSPGQEEEAGGGAVPGRPRTKFSAAQLQELERSFREQRYIGTSEKRRLAAVLNLSQSQIKTWFQNRRMKFKRQTQDARVEALFSGLFLPYHRCPDIVTSSCSHEMDINASSTPTVCLHPAMPSPALLPFQLSPFSQLCQIQLYYCLPSPGLSCYSSATPSNDSN
ncbi:homeobox protein vex1-like [Melanerpes formicivorus]|uniref:homeobox protein vex1-like n=1 Tax=Melanerpes formicivorus TaxID=211600 RepID=UPI00358E4A4B